MPEVMERDLNRINKYLKAYKILQNKKQVEKKILYIDMDNVLVDFKSGIDQLSEEVKKEYEGRLDEVPHIFSLMKPMPKAIESYRTLADNFDTYILSTAPWKNPTASHDKFVWVIK